MSSSAEHEGSGFSVDDERTKQKELVLARSPLLQTFLNEDENILDWQGSLDTQAKPYATLFNEHTYQEWVDMLHPLMNIGRISNLFNDKHEGENKVPLLQVSSYLVFIGHELKNKENISLFLEDLSNRFLNSHYANENRTDATKIIADIYIADCLVTGASISHKYELDNHAPQEQEKEVTIWEPGMFKDALHEVDLEGFTGKKGKKQPWTPGLFTGALDEIDMSRFSGPKGVPGALFNWTPGSFEGVLENLDLDEFDGPPPKK